MKETPVLKVARDFTRVAESNGICVVVIGGLAMQYHGCPRATPDLDLVSDAVIPYPGGKEERDHKVKYAVTQGDTTVDVDLLVRAPRRKHLFDSVLQNHQRCTGVNFLNPYWLFIIKSLSARPKDIDDCAWLRKNGVVHLDTLRNIVEGSLFEEGVSAVWKNVSRAWNSGEQDHPTIESNATSS